MSFTLTVIIPAILSLIINSFIEWAAHRYPMHKRLPGPLFKFLFQHHVEIHHGQFSAGAYHHRGNDGRETIAFPLWVASLLIATAVLPWALLSWYIDNWNPFGTSLAVAIMYYLAFEGIHEVMHMADDPKVAWIRNSRWFKFLDEHHRRHHIFPKANFNLVLPFADWATRTLWKNQTGKSDGELG